MGEGFLLTNFSTLGPSKLYSIADVFAASSIMCPLPQQRSHVEYPSVDLSSAVKTGSDEFTVCWF